MIANGSDLQTLTTINASAAFNRLASFEVIEAGNGDAVLRMPWRDEFGQYSGHLHAGLIAALLDTACGFAAVTVAGRVTASHFSMNCLRPALGEYFLAKGTTVRAGRKQIFARAELFAGNAQGGLSLVATGETVLVPVSADAQEK